MSFKPVESNSDIPTGLVLLAIRTTVVERLTPTRSMQVTNEKSKKYLFCPRASAQQDNGMTVQPEQLKHPRRNKSNPSRLSASIFCTNKDRMHRGSTSQYHFLVYKSCIYIYEWAVSGLGVAYGPKKQYGEV
jgi:hypothetical protein